MSAASIAGKRVKIGRNREYKRRKKQSFQKSSEKFGKGRQKLLTVVTKLCIIKPRTDISELILAWIRQEMRQTKEKETEIWNGLPGRSIS